MSRFFKSAAFPILVVVLLAFLAVKLVNTGSSNHRPHSYQTLVASELPRGEVEAVQFKNKGKALEVKYRNKETAEFGFIDQAAPELIRELRSAGVQYNVESEKSSAILSLLTYILPFVIFLGFWIFLMNQVQGGGSKVMSFGKSRAKRLSADSPKITFRDVAGVDEAVEELHEIKEFLENPKKFQALGARIPTRVLLYGPPGTGKTLLARPVAGGAGVPFVSVSGSHARRAAGAGDRHRRARGPDAGLHRSGPLQPDQRGGAAVGAHGQARDRPGRARGGDHARDRRPREEDARDERERAADHRLPRDGPRAGGALPRALRPRAQDLGDIERPGAGLHDLDAPGRPLPDHARGAARLDGDDAGRARRRGADLRGDNDRRLQRHREGHRDGQADGDALRHEREARPARVRP